MTQNWMFVTITGALSMGLFACEDSGGSQSPDAGPGAADAASVISPDAASPDAASPDAPMAVRTKLEGRWLSDCLPEDSAWLTYEWRFDGSRFQSSTSHYEDDKCTEKLAVTLVLGSFELAGDADVQEIDYTLIGATAMILSQEFVDLFNEVQALGYDDWEVNAVVDVLSAPESALRVGTILPDVVLSGEGTLRLGTLDLLNWVEELPTGRPESPADTVLVSLPELTGRYQSPCLHGDPLYIQYNWGFAGEAFRTSFGYYAGDDCRESDKITSFEGTGRYVVGYAADRVRSLWGATFFYNEATFTLLESPGPGIDFAYLGYTDWTIGEARDVLTAPETFLSRGVAVPELLLFDATTLQLGTVRAADHAETPPQPRPESLSSVVLTTAP